MLLGGGGLSLLAAGATVFAKLEARFAQESVDESVGTADLLDQPSEAGTTLVVVSQGVRQLCVLAAEILTSGCNFMIRSKSWRPALGTVGSSSACVQGARAVSGVVTIGSSLGVRKRGRGPRETSLAHAGHLPDPDVRPGGVCTTPSVGSRYSYCVSRLLDSALFF